MIKVYDDLFDDRYLHNLYASLENEIQYTAGNTANRSTWPYGDKGSHKIFGTTVFRRENLNRVTVLSPYAQRFFDVFEMIEKKMGEELYLDYISINLQHQYCDGSLHTDGDSNQRTIMLMANPIWNPDWGGEFQIQDPFAPGKIQYEYIPGRVLVFPSHLEHQGFGPKHDYGYRYTIVFRVS